MNNKEIRMNQQIDFTISDNENEMIIEGYPIVFNSRSEYLGFNEIIDKNALNGCDLSDVVLKYNHEDSHLLLARTKNNSLVLNIDDVGLHMKATLIDTTSNRDIYKSLKAKLLDKMSFAFSVQEDKYDVSQDLRTILKIDKLFDVSIVDVPAYEGTDVYARALTSLQHEKDIILKRKKLNLKLKIGE